MTVSYSNLNSTASRLIKNFGQSITFNRYSETYNISSATSVSSSSFTADVVMLNKPVAENDFAEERVTHNALASSTTAIDIGDIADINSESLRVVGVTKVQPATEVLMYELQFTS